MKFTNASTIAREISVHGSCDLGTMLVATPSLKCIKPPASTCKDPVELDIRWSFQPPVSGVDKLFPSLLERVWLSEQRAQAQVQDPNCTPEIEVLQIAHIASESAGFGIPNFLAYRLTEDGNLETFPEIS